MDPPGGVMRMNRFLNGKITDDAGIRKIHQVAGNPDLEWPDPESALTRRTGGIEFVKRCHTAARQVASQVPRELAKPNRNATRLITIIRVVQDHVLMISGQSRRGVGIPSRNHREFV